IVSAIHAKGGDVLKLIGDGILAIFTAADRAHTCAAALSAAMAARSKVAALNERRAREGLPVTDMYLGLHAREVFYGNIGSTERLDFTVLGPAVNETSRIADVPLGRATGAGVGGFRQCRLHAQPPRIGRPLRVARGCATARAFHAR